MKINHTISGRNLLKKENTDIMEKSAAMKRKCEPPNSKKLVKSVSKCSSKTSKLIHPTPSTSGLSKTDEPINLIAEDSVATDIDDGDDDEEKLCLQ